MEERKRAGGGKIAVPLKKYFKTNSAEFDVSHFNHKTLYFSASSYCHFT